MVNAELCWTLGTLWCNVCEGTWGWERRQLLSSGPPKGPLGPGVSGVDPSGHAANDAMLFDPCRLGRLARVPRLVFQTHFIGVVTEQSGEASPSSPVLLSGHRTSLFSHYNGVF